MGTIPPITYTRIEQSDIQDQNLEKINTFMRQVVQANTAIASTFASQQAVASAAPATTTPSTTQTTSITPSISGVTGSGIPGRLTKWSSATAVTSSLTLEDGTTGFWGVAGASLNASNSTGYVVEHIDNTFTNPGNEMRGVSVVQRYTRTTADANVMGDGWDVRPVSGVIVLTAMALPTDNTLRGNYKCFSAEHYFQPAASSTYIVEPPAIGYQASLVQVDSTCTVDNWSGFVASQPVGGSAGAVLIGYGLWVQNLSDNATLADNTIVAVGAAGIKIDGLNTYGRILWTDASIECPSSGLLELYGSTRVQTATGTGFFVGGANANSGLGCGSIQVNETTTPYSALVSINNDGMNQGNISTLGYVAAAGAAGFYFGSDQFAFQNGGDNCLSTVGVGVTIKDNTGTYQGIDCGSLSNNGTEIMTGLVTGTCNLQNINAITAIGTILTTGHFDCSTGSYYVDGVEFIFKGGSDYCVAALGVGITVKDTGGTYQGVDCGSLSNNGTEIMTGLSAGYCNLQNINAITAIGTILTGGHFDAPTYYASGTPGVSGTYTAANITVAGGIITAASNGSAGISGSGTSGYIPVFNGSASVTDSIMQTVGSTILVTGSFTATVNINALGEYLINNVAGATGTSTAGTGTVTVAGGIVTAVT